MEENVCCQPGKGKLIFATGKYRINRNAVIPAAKFLGAVKDEHFQNWLLLDFGDELQIWNLFLSSSCSSA